MTNQNDRQEVKSTNIITVIAGACIIFFIIHSFILFQYKDNNNNNIIISMTKHVQRVLDQQGIDAPKSLILDWTGFFGTSFLRYWEGAKQNCYDIAQYCTFTRNKQRVTEADVILIHQRDIKYEPKALPSKRFLNQKYIFILLESPYHAGNLKSLSSTYMNFYNYTMTYRRDSDIHWPYFKFRKLLPDERSNYLQEMEKRLASKSIPIAWLASNCETPSKRENYVSELKKHIQVDIYGHCGKLSTCPKKNQDECNEMLSHKYWFYLALENSVCKDYVTEKFLKIKNYLLPIVFKHSIYKDIVPPDSFIALDKYETMSDLVDHLHYLMKNKTAYLEYFQWSKHYTFDNLLSDSNPWCDLCRKSLYDNNTKIIPNMETYYGPKNNCDENFGDTLRRKHST